MNRTGRRGYKKEKRRRKREKEGARERGRKRERRKGRQPLKGGDCGLRLRAASVGCLSPYSTPPPQLTLCCYLNCCLLLTVLCRILHPDIGLICDYVSAKAQVDCLPHSERSMHDNPVIAADGVVCVSIRLRRHLEHLRGQKGATLMDPSIRSTIKTTYLLWGSLSLSETAIELTFDHDTY